MPKRTETEVKIRVADLGKLRRKLRSLGFRAVHRRAFEDNVLFDTPDRALRQVRRVLRLRRYGSSWWLTYKGTPQADTRYKSRMELESELSDPLAVAATFQALGLTPVFQYQKYRTHFALPATGGGLARVEVALDETPIGNFIEIEGSRTSIDRVARRLGFSSEDYSTASYGALYLEACRKRNVQPADMTFAREGRERTSRRAGLSQTRKGRQRRVGRSAAK